MKARSIISAGVIVAIGMVAGRVLGLLREVAIAAYFGTTGHADAAIFLLLVPDFITVVFIGSAGSAALIPAFAARSEEKALTLLWQTMLASIGGFTFIAVIMFSLNSYIAGLFAVDINSLPDLKEAVFFTAFSLPFMAATWVFTAWLQYRERFVAPAFANALFNIIILLTLWLAHGDILTLSIGSFIASGLRLGTHVFSFVNGGEKIRNCMTLFAKKWEIDKKFSVIYMQASLTGILAMLPIYAPYFIITANSGGLALFNYAFKLVLLPSILLQTMIQTVILPLFVRQHKNNEPHIRQKMHSLSLQLGYICGFSVALAVMLGAEPISSLCFGHGKMSPQDISEISSLLRIGIWATPFAILSCLWQQMLYAGHNAKSAMMASVMSTILLIPIYWLGLKIGGAYGVMTGYIMMTGYIINSILFLAQIIIFGKKYLPFSSFIPSKDYIYSSSAMIGVFIVSSLLYISFLPVSYNADIIKALLAIIIGGALLASGILASKQTRDALLRR